MSLPNLRKPEIDGIEFFKQKPARKHSYNLHKLHMLIGSLAIAVAALSLTSTRNVDHDRHSLVSARGVAYDLTHPSTSFLNAGHLAMELIHMDSLPTALTCDYFCQRDRLIVDSRKLVWSFGQGEMTEAQFTKRKMGLMKRYDRLEDPK